MVISKVFLKITNIYWILEYSTDPDIIGKNCTGEVTEFYAPKEFEIKNICISIVYIFKLYGVFSCENTNSVLK